jgi:hypothetical protein
LLVQIPDELLQRDTLDVLVRMDSVRAAGGALSSLWLGPITELRPRFDTRRLLQNLVPQITSSIFLVLGVFALGFWMRRRHETSQLLFFVLSVLFYIRSLHYYIEDTRITQSWFQWVTVNSLGWLNVTVYFFAYTLHRQRFRSVERLLLGAMILATVMSIPFQTGDTNLPLLSPLAYLILMVVSFAVTFFLSFIAWRIRSLESAVLAGVRWINVGLVATKLAHRY